MGLLSDIHDIAEASKSSTPGGPTGFKVVPATPTPPPPPPAPTP